ncbi:hypothetical protein BJF78_31695 [Pseudonocardia sp. CNS-139]|nr:hypothetical protein BJF78_31695 [Pseudonocardia sp. CNS-139]
MTGSTTGTDCVVVGAGPTGLMTALLLARTGRTVEVLERRPAAEPPPGGVVLQPATLGLFEQLGALDALTATGSRITGVDEVVGGAVTYAADYADLPGVPVPFALAVPLRAVWGALTDLVGRHAEVRTVFGAEVDGIDQDDAGCVVRTSAGAHRGRFVVGATASSPPSGGWPVSRPRSTRCRGASSSRRCRARPGGRAGCAATARSARSS